MEKVKVFWISFAHDEDEKGILTDLQYICWQLGLITSGINDDPNAYGNNPMYVLAIKTNENEVEHIRWMHNVLVKKFKEGR